jgi:hypothetical protein
MALRHAGYQTALWPTPQAASKAIRLEVCQHVEPLREEERVAEDGQVGEVVVHAGEGVGGALLVQGVLEACVTLGARGEEGEDDEDGLAAPRLGRALP